jgi:hypothetical protein
VIYSVIQDFGGLIFHSGIITHSGFRVKTILRKQALFFRRNACAAFLARPRAAAYNETIPHETVQGICSETDTSKKE